MLRTSERIEGRLVDSMRLADGRLLSPYVRTEAVERLPGLVRYQIVQEVLDHFTMHAEGEPADRAAVEASIVRTIREAVGSPVAVEVH